LGAYPFNASAPLTISVSSVVIVACRARFICSVSRAIMSTELFVAESIAVIRAPCSPATDSRRMRKSIVCTYFGSSVARTSSREGAYR